MKKFIWLSFELSLNGDYEGLFKWLDEKEAKECGEGLACFYFNFDSDDEVKELIESIKENVSINDKRDRLYAVWNRKTGNTKGCFLIGQRKRSPWEGMSGLASDDVDGD